MPILEEQEICKGPAHVDAEDLSHQRVLDSERVGLGPEIRSCG